MTDDERIAALYIGPDSEIALRPDWTDDESPEGWSRLYCYEEVAAGILRLLRERDDFRHGNDHWVKMHDQEAAAHTQAERERDEARANVETFRASMYALEDRVSELIRERDEARQKAADWEQTARELTARVKP